LSIAIIEIPYWWERLAAKLKRTMFVDWVMIYNHSSLTPPHHLGVEIHDGETPIESQAEAIDSLRSDEQL
jgi:hypothetical protein